MVKIKMLLIQNKDKDIWRTESGAYYLLLLTGDREYGETVFPSSSERALLVLTEYYRTQTDDYWYEKKNVHSNLQLKGHVNSVYTKKTPLGWSGWLQTPVFWLGVLDFLYARS